MTLPSQEFMIDNFRFKNFSPTDGSVHCIVQYVRGFNEGMNEEREKEVLELLKDMSKWEGLAQLIRDLKEIQPISQNFGWNLYRINNVLDRDDGVLSLSFGLKNEEALRRTKGNDSALGPEMDEIITQIRNISKWRNFTNVVKNVKAI